MPFSEQDYYSEFKRIRNRFRRFDPPSLIGILLQYGNAGSSNREIVERRPWLSLLLVKWILLDEEFHDQARPYASNRDMQRLMADMSHLADATRMPGGFDGFMLFVRRLGHQQFFFQSEFQGQEFMRQFLLFDELDERSSLHRAFRDEVGLSVAEYLMLSLALICQSHDPDVSLLCPEYFHTLKLEGIQPKAKAFFEALSSDLAGLREFLLRENGRERWSNEYFEQTPFTKKPLIKVRGGYRVIQNRVFLRGMEHFVYDRLRDSDPQKFMSWFGPRFERYVEIVIKETRLPFLTEKDLCACLREGEKPVDFVIEDGDSRVLVEAKGIAGSHEMMVGHDGRRILEKTKGTAFKAIIQGLDTAMRIEEGRVPDLAPGKENFLLVVTYKALHLMNGVEFKRMTKNDEEESSLWIPDDSPALPLANFYFLSISTFEYLCRCLADASISLGEALRRAREADADLGKMKFDFSMHLLEWGFPRLPLGPLENRFNMEFKKLEMLLR